MPRNEVVERMAKKAREQEVKDGTVMRDWDELPERLKELCRNAALELLEIAEESTYDGTGIDGEEILVCEDDLVEALQLAREAREGKEK